MRKLSALIFASPLERNLHWLVLRRETRSKIPRVCILLIPVCHSSQTKDHTELESLPDVVNDLDVDFSDDLAASDAYKNDQRNIRKVKEATEELELNIIHPLRQGKKLLVLDIDYSEHT